MKILSALVLSALMASISGCVVAQTAECEAVDVNGNCVALVYEPDVIVGEYYVGFYRPGFGYWTGFGWDPYFYVYGHPGYSHYYRGAPRGAWGAYHGGPHFHGGGHVGGHGHR